MARTTPVNSGYMIINGAGTGPNGSRIDVWIEYKVTDQSIENNTSTIRAYLYAARKSDASSNTWGSNGRQGTVTIDSNQSTVSTGGYDFRDTTARLMASHERTVTHNDDGTKQINISGAFTTSSSWISGGSVSGTVTLSTIARASDFTMPESVTLGQSATVTVTPKSSGFLHDVWYSIYSDQYGVAMNEQTREGVFTPPLNIANSMPGKTREWATMFVDTWVGAIGTGGTMIGRKSKIFYLDVPPSIVPSISNIALSERESAIQTQFGCYVQGKSRLHVDVTAAGAYHSTISSYQTGTNGQTFSTASFDTDLLSTVGTNNVTVTVSDSRGRNATETVQYSVVEYHSPMLSSVTAQRCVSDGTPQDDGTYLVVDVQGKISPVNNHNTRGLIIKYKKTGDEEFASHVVELNSYTINTQQIISGFDVNYTYDVVVELTDYFKTEQRNISIPTEKTILDFNAAGDGMAIGKVSEGTGLDIAWDTHFRGNMIFEPHNGLLTYGRLPLIAEGGDLNHFKTPGQWSTGTNAYAATLQNSPSEIGGKLTISYGFSPIGTQWADGYIVQTYETWNAKIFKRCWDDYSKEWTAWEQLVTASMVAPIGSIVIWSAATAPTGWMLCRHQAISRTEYSELFSLIGTQYGGGDGSTTFNLPGLNGRIPVGQDPNDSDFNVVGVWSGEKAHTLTIGEIPPHAHSMNVDVNTSYHTDASNIMKYAGWDNNFNEFGVESTGGGQAHNNMPPYLVLNYIIRVK